MRDEDTPKTEQGSGSPSKKDRPLTPIERTIGMMLCAALALFLLYLGLAATAGCAAIDADEAYTIYTNISVRVKGSGASGENVGAPSSGDAPEPSSSPFIADWRYGGFNGGSAVEDKSCQIKSVSTSGKGVTFKLSGSWWGATHESPTMRCCAFYKDSSGKWVGGFWEWGSPDRTYRAFTNINDGYKGWDAKAFFAAKKHGFVICSKDGKKRSNFIED